MRKKTAILLSATLLTMVITTLLPATEPLFSNLTPDQKRSEDILAELVSFESTVEHPAETHRALQAMANRLRQAGFPDNDIQLVNPADDQFGLVVYYRGIAEKRPLLLLAHVDVVTATPDAWSFPPFTLGKQNGYYVGRGTEDNKAGVTQIISNFIRLKQEGWVPKRDLIAAISGDEETAGSVAQWLSGEGRELIDAEYAINSDAGYGEYSDSGERRAFWVQTSEKLYQTYQLTATNEGGHSSVPRPDNAIQDLATATTSLANYRFPIILNDGTRMQLRRAAAMYPKNIARDMLVLAENESDQDAAQNLSVKPAFNAMLRTTCVPTMLSGGHAENALPRDATVTVNCRILPGTPAVAVEKEIARLVSGQNITVKAIYQGLPSEASVLPDAILENIETLVEERWGDVPVIPNMSTGATDGLFYRNAGIPVYGISAIFGKPGDSRAHGLDERIGIQDFHESVAFWYQMLKTLGR